MRQQSVIIESEGKVWSVYKHNVNPKMRLKDMAIWIYKMAAKYNRKWRCSIRRPENPTLEQTRSRSDDVSLIWPFEVFQFVWIGLRSVVGRSYSGSSIFILLTPISYTPLSLRGVKIGFVNYWNAASVQSLQVFEILSLKCVRYATLIIIGHVTSSVTWPFDLP